jgi:hypothetical protein
VHRRTLNTSYLATARHMASYFLDHMPADGIVPWDFQAPLNPPRPADSSAAMIATNGLLLLARQEQVISNTSGAEYWTNAAMKVRSSVLFRPLNATEMGTALRRQCAVFLEAAVAEPARERDGEQSRAQQSDWHHLRFVAFARLRYLLCVIDHR